MKSFDEIIMDPKFIEYMDLKTSDSVIYWEKLVETGLVLNTEFEEAKKIYSALSGHKKEKISTEEKLLASRELLFRINKYEKSGSGKRISYSLKKWMSVAATVIILIGLFFSVRFYLKSLPVSNEIVYNEITVPSGEKSTVKLSDGTVVWLNSESKLKYPSAFNSNNRDVYLEGEGYFDVAKQNGKKFTVNTQDVKVVALGTKFDVKSYPDDDKIEATLVEGSIKFQQISDEKNIPDIILKPNQRLVFQKKSSKVIVNSAQESKKITTKSSSQEIEPSYSIKKVNTSNIVCWKDHLLIFDNETFEEIAKKMSRWYNMQVVIHDDELKELHFTGKFIHNETYVQVLEAIDLTTPISYNVNDKTIFIQSSQIIQPNGNKSK